VSASDPPGRSSHRHTQVFWLWAPVVLYMAGIFFVSSLSEPPMPSNVSDVSLHSASYFGLTLLLIRALSGNQWGGVSLATLAAAWGIAAAYGVTDEWHQSFVPSRYAEWRDVVANAIGAFAAVVIVGAWGIIRRL
jgi:VanZ family protein